MVQTYYSKHILGAILWQGDARGLMEDFLSDFVTPQVTSKCQDYMPAPWLMIVECTLIEDSFKTGKRKTSDTFYPTF